MAAKKKPKKNKQQEKRVRQDAKLNEANRIKRSALRTAIKKARTTKKPEDVQAAHSAIDSALSKNLIKKNNASRTKSRITVAAVKA